jgi:hypothetical protein
MNLINEKDISSKLYMIYISSDNDGHKSSGLSLVNLWPSNNNNNNNNNNNTPLSRYFKVTNSRHCRLRHEHQLILFPYSNPDVIRDDNSVAGGLLR